MSGRLCKIKEFHIGDIVIVINPIKNQEEKHINSKPESDEEKSSYEVIGVLIEGYHNLYATRFKYENKRCVVTRVIDDSAKANIHGVETVIFSVPSRYILRLIDEDEDSDENKELSLIEWSSEWLINEDELPMAAFEISENDFDTFMNWGKDNV